MADYPTHWVGVLADMTSDDPEDLATYFTDYAPEDDPPPEALLEGEVLIVRLDELRAGRWRIVRDDGGPSPIGVIHIAQEWVP